MVNGPHTLPDDIEYALAAVASRLHPLVPTVFWYPSVTSTNTVAAALADAGAPEGTMVVADAQTAGRGRQGRSWSSPAGAGLYMSIILRPSSDQAARVTIVAGVAMAEGIRAATGLGVQVKWPNDLYVGPRKLGGILAESAAARDGSTSVVLGCGINVRSSIYPPEIAMRATSIEAELGRSIDRGVVFAECLVSLASRYADMTAGRFPAVLDAWRAHVALTFGRTVEWDGGGAVRRGVAERVDDAGALLVRTETGLERVISGEIRWT